LQLSFSYSLSSPLKESLPRSFVPKENFTTSTPRIVKIALLDPLPMEPFIYQNVSLAQKALTLLIQAPVNVQNVLQAPLLSLELRVWTNALHISVHQDQLFHLPTLINVRSVKQEPTKSIEPLVKIVPQDLTQTMVLMSVLPVQQER